MLYSTFFFANLCYTVLHNSNLHAFQKAITHKNIILHSIIIINTFGSRWRSASSMHETRLHRRSYHLDKGGIIPLKGVAQPAKRCGHTQRGRDFWNRDSIERNMLTNREPRMRRGGPHSEKSTYFLRIYFKVQKIYLHVGSRNVPNSKLKYVYLWPI
jgi:hypothetical protein